LDTDITWGSSWSNRATKWWFLDALAAEVGCTTDEGDFALNGRAAAILFDAALEVEGTRDLYARGLPNRMLTSVGSASGQRGCPHTD
jgi:hypothetical protein